MARMILLDGTGLLLSSGCHRATLTSTPGSAWSAEQARAVAHRVFTRQKQPDPLVLTSSATS